MIIFLLLSALFYYNVARKVTEAVNTTYNRDVIASNDLFNALYPVYTHLPSKDRGRFKVFIYDLPKKYNVEILTKIEQTRVQSNCDFARTPCLEVTRDETKGTSHYSNDRQYAAEVPILAKFLMMERANSSNADFFVVPFFGATSKIFDGCRWESCHASDETIINLLPLLSHFKGDLRRRHIFLSSRDARGTSFFRFPAISHSAIILHYGPKIQQNDIIIPPNDAGFGYPMSSLNLNRTHFIFCMIGIVNDIRKLWFSQLSTLASTRPDLNIKLLEIIDHRTFKITIAEVQTLMQNSELCPIPQGDLPYQHRLFDTIVAGCVPVIVTHKINANYTSYFTKNGTVHHLVKDLDTLPFKSQIPWKEIILEMPADVFYSQETFTEFFTLINLQDISSRRDKIAKIRHLLVYNLTSESDDAFTAVLNELETTSRSYSEIL